MKQLIILLTFAFSFFILNCKAQQNEKIDSLKQIIENTQNDTIKNSALIHWSNLIYFSDPQKEAELMEQVILISKKNLAADISEKEKLKYNSQLIIAHNNLGSNFEHQSNLPKSLEHHFEALRLIQMIEAKNPNEMNQFNMAKSLNNIGIVYLKQGKNRIALDYYTKSLSIKSKLLHSEDKKMADLSQKNLSTTYNNIGNVYDHLKQPYNALEYHKKALELVMPDNNIQQIAMYQSNLGSDYAGVFQEIDSIDIPVGKKLFVNSPKELLDTALAYQFKALDIQTKLNDNFYLFMTLEDIGDIYLLMKDYETSINYFKKGKQVAETFNSNEHISGAHKRLSKVYKEQAKAISDYKIKSDLLAQSVYHHELYSSFKDSVFSEQKLKDIGKLEAQFEYEKKQIRGEQQRNEELRTKNEELRRRNNLQYSIILFVLLAIGGSLLVIGKFKIKPQFAEGLIFFAFLILFEFLLVLADPYVDNWTGGAPGWKLALNAGIAAGIFPLHSFFERALKNKLVKSS